MAKVVCAWLRNDLRIHDSQVLHRAAELCQQLGIAALPVFIFDPRHFRKTRFRTLKTGPRRALFQLESVLQLKRSLRQIGSDLVIAVGCPEEVLPRLVSAGSVVVTQQEVTSEELRVDSRVQAALGESVRWEAMWGSTLYHVDDLPFCSDLQDLPNMFTQFKNLAEPELATKVNTVPPSFNEAPKAESSMKVRPCLPDPAAGSLALPKLDGAILTFEPAWADLPYAEPVEQEPSHEDAVLAWTGGEQAGLQRLHQYMLESSPMEGTCPIATYADTRNDMLGANASTKLAPWIANGCLSPRRIFEVLREHECIYTSGRNTYWFLFSFFARDFFRFFAKKQGDAIFREGGPLGRPKRWRGGDAEFTMWAEGRTGYPLVDANMRELRQTGWMSNRGRQNVASFLIFDMSVDWRRGADWFESQLLDYDVTSNWVNWVMAAGLTGGRINRFNILKQSQQYDPKGDYLRHWLPELLCVPVASIHEPWRMSEAERLQHQAKAYPEPCVDPSSFMSYAGGAGTTHYDSGKKHTGKSHVESAKAGGHGGQRGRGYNEISRQ